MIFFLFFNACNQSTPTVKKALQKAGRNRHELEFVLEHYSKTPADSLKFQAACFLIGNMPYHRSYEVKPYAAYCHALDSLYARERSGEEYNAGARDILNRFIPQLKLQEDSRHICRLFDLEHRLFVCTMARFTVSTASEFRRILRIRTPLQVP